MQAPCTCTPVANAHQAITACTRLCLQYAEWLGVDVAGADDAAVGSARLSPGDPPRALQQPVTAAPPADTTPEVPALSRSLLTGGRATMKITEQVKVQQINNSCRVTRMTVHPLTAHGSTFARALLLLYNHTMIIPAF